MIDEITWIKKRIGAVFFLSLSFYSRQSFKNRITSLQKSFNTSAAAEKSTDMGDSMITPSIEYDYLIKFLALGDSGVGKSDEDEWE